MGFEAFEGLLGGMLWHTTLTWGPHSPGFEENLDNDDDSENYIKIIGERPKARCNNQN
jgi:hypothetical protein